MAQCLEIASTIYMNLSKRVKKKLKALHLANPVVLALRSLTHMGSSINFKGSVHMRKTCGVQSVVLYRYAFM